MDTKMDTQIVVDYTKSLEALMESSKIWIDYAKITDEEFVTPKLLIGKKEEILIKLFDFNDIEGISFEEVLAHIRNDGYEPATLRETLFLCSNQPELPRLFPIISLGSIISRFTLQNPGYSEEGEIKLSAPLLEVESIRRGAPLDSKAINLNLTGLVPNYRWLFRNSSRTRFPGVKKINNA
jgi:hypothetical protein